ncbi:MAG: hypothetical protein WC583_04090 [Candidatus Omnitrophota bacterium]
MKKLKVIVVRVLRAIGCPMSLSEWVVFGIFIVAMTVARVVSVYYPLIGLGLTIYVAAAYGSYIGIVAYKELVGGDHEG